MRENGLRGDNRNDPVAHAVTADPDIVNVLADRATKETQNAIGDVIQRTDERKLAGWVAVAVWEDEDGKISHSVIGDDHSSFLELKGYLHDGIWVAAHAE